MEDLFEALWKALYQHGASERKKEGTKRFWDSLSETQQRQVFTTITQKLREDRFVQYDPIRAIQENIRHVSTCLTLSYAEYYAKYGTTEECDGWKRKFLPEKQKTIFIKS